MRLRMNNQRVVFRSLLLLDGICHVSFELPTIAQKLPRVHSYFSHAAKNAGSKKVKNAEHLVRALNMKTFFTALLSPLKLRTKRRGVRFAYHMCWPCLARYLS